MGRLTYKQSIQAFCGANTQTPGQIGRKSYQVDPPDILNFYDINESDGSDFNVPIGATNFTMPFGTVDSAKIILIKPDVTDLTVHIVNGVGTSQLVTFAADRLSVWHTVGVTAILATNTSGVAITGIMFVAGD